MGLQYSMNLSLDLSFDHRPWFGQISPKLAILARPTVTYQDLHTMGEVDPPYSITPALLASTFICAVCARFEKICSVTLENCRICLGEAGRDTFDFFPAAARSGVGALEYSVIYCDSEKDILFALNLGPNMIVKISSAQISEVVRPHSVFCDEKSDRISGKEAAVLALVSTEMLTPNSIDENRIRSGQVGLKVDDWLLVVPGSPAISDLRLEQHPKTVAELERNIVGDLTEPFAGYPRVWLAVQAMVA